MQPRFSWAPVHSVRGATMTGWQVQVWRGAHNSSTSALVWDSGRVLGNTSTNIVYDGVPLVSDTSYDWSVVWWDEAGLAAPSTFAHFSTAMFAGITDFKGAAWVGGGKMLRSEFVVPTGARGAIVVTRARLFITGLGAYKSYLNGQATDSHELGTFTAYEQRVLYDVWDVTSLVQIGCNGFGVLIGGWYWASKGQTLAGQGQPTLLVLISVDTSDGARTYFASSTSTSDAAVGGVVPLHFATAASPITADSFAGGIDYDASLKQVGWDRCYFHPTAAWTPASAGVDALGVNPRGGYPTFSANSLHITIERSFPIRNFYPRTDGSVVVDFGQVSC